jgi:ribose-phosphate pyrophosphokinase
MSNFQTDNIMIFTGNSNRELASSIADQLGIALGKATVERFSDGEILVEILENVRGREVFIIQSTSAPCNDNLMELVIMADALHRASASNITAVIPYFGYARQDRRVRSRRVPISAKVVADMISCVHIDRLVTVDLHADQIQGFFNIPVDNVYGTQVMYDDIFSQKFEDLVVVSPDVGGVVRARAIAKHLNDADLVIIDKRRQRHNQSEVMNVIGDVKNRDCIIVDDMLDTGGTMCAAAAVLIEQGAKTVTAYCTHAVLSGNAIDNIMNSALKEVVVTDTVKLGKYAAMCPKIRQLSLSSLLAQTIVRINDNRSISSMFD